MKHDTEPFSLHGAKCKRCGQTWDLEKNVPGEGCVKVIDDIVEIQSTSFIAPENVVHPSQIITPEEVADGGKKPAPESVIVAEVKPRDLVTITGKMPISNSILMKRDQVGHCGDSYSGLCLTTAVREYFKNCPDGRVFVAPDEWSPQFQAISNKDIEKAISIGATEVPVRDKEGEVIGSAEIRYEEDTIISNVKLDKNIQSFIEEHMADQNTPFSIGATSYSTPKEDDKPLTKEELREMCLNKLNESIDSMTENVRKLCNELWHAGNSVADFSRAALFQDADLMKDMFYQCRDVLRKRRPDYPRRLIIPEEYHNAWIESLKARSVTQGCGPLTSDRLVMGIPIISSEALNGTDVIVAEYMDDKGDYPHARIEVWKIGSEE